MKRLLLIISITLFCTQAWAAELYVRPGDYNSIQAAIDNANNGDSVIIEAGTYYENINFRGKAITLRPADPNDPNIVAQTI